MSYLVSGKLILTIENLRLLGISLGFVPKFILTVIGVLPILTANPVVGNPTPVI
jgi:hypothetical protein